MQGSPSQQAMGWSRPQWQEALPRNTEFLRGLPDAVGRTDVIKVCATAAASPADAERGFVAAMIWGYGTVGYGPYRTARVLTANAQAPEVLHHVADVAVTRGGVAAFEALKADRLKWLGVAFATKYLFFCAENGGAGPAPVLDRLVRGWLGDHTGWAPRLDWQLGDYTTYVQAVVAWAGELQMRPADVELLMFRSAANADPTSRWRQEPDAVEGLSDGDRTVLDALEDAADAFAALEPTPLDVEAVDFEMGSRMLRRIVLARRRT